MDPKEGTHQGRRVADSSSRAASSPSTTSRGSPRTRAAELSGVPSAGQDVMGMVIPSIFKAITLISLLLGVPAKTTKALPGPNRLHPKSADGAAGLMTRQKPALLPMLPASAPPPPPAPRPRPVGSSSQAEAAPAPTSDSAGPLPHTSSARTPTAHVDISTPIGALKTMKRHAVDAATSSSSKRQKTTQVAQVMPPRMVSNPPSSPQPAVPAHTTKKRTSKKTTAPTSSTIKPSAHGRKTGSSSPIGEDNPAPASLGPKATTKPPPKARQKRPAEAVPVTRSRTLRPR
jgi:hypothetical protein